MKIANFENRLRELLDQDVRVVPSLYFPDLLRILPPGRKIPFKNGKYVLLEKKLKRSKTLIVNSFCCHVTREFVEKCKRL